VAEGPKLVKELIEAETFECMGVYALQEWMTNDIKSDFNLHADIIEIVTESELQKISSLSTPKQVLAVFKKKIQCKEFSVKDNITLVLDDIQDPGNLGTIIRTADWFGVKNMVCSLQTADMYNSKVVQSTMSSLARVNIIYTDIENWLKENHKVKIYAAVLNGKNLHEIGRVDECILLIGNESKGLSEKIISLADEKITIKKIGKAESLNAAVANAIILHQFCVNK
jgi:TrmH family RNA methyltransferase